MQNKLRRVGEMYVRSLVKMFVEQYQFITINHWSLFSEISAINRLKVGDHKNINVNWVLTDYSEQKNVTILLWSNQRIMKLMQNETRDRVFAVDFISWLSLWYETWLMVHDVNKWQSRKVTFVWVNYKRHMNTKQRWEYAIISPIQDFINQE